MVEKLVHSTQKIGEVMALIQTIAGQTNLLALNATIEAARAGEAGKGFAVVANEVKALSSQTAKATDEIASPIQAIRDATGSTVDAIREIGTTIGQMNEIAGSIAAAVEEQGAATQEIARSVQQAAQGATQVTGNIGEVSRGASDTGAAAGQVHGSAQALLAESNRLENEVRQFLATVREYNQAIRGDVPFNPNVKDGRRTEGLAIDKSNWAIPVEQPPFEAYSVGCGITFTFGGLKIDSSGHVLDIEDSPIPGLFAAGVADVAFAAAAILIRPPSRRRDRAPAGPPRSSARRRRGSSSPPGRAARRAGPSPRPPSSRS